MKIEIKLLCGTDVDAFLDLIDVFEDVFDMQPFPRPSVMHLGNLLRKKDFKVLVALDDGEVIGGLTMYVLEQYFSAKPLAYILDLAVTHELQRRGVGRKLVAEAVAYCRDNGFEEVFVQADKVDDYAIDFYRKTGPTAEEKVVHFYYRLSG